jgi:hypothetical protein
MNGVAPSDRITEVAGVRVESSEDAMQIPILIEPLEGDRFRAKAGAPFELSEEAATKEEAVCLLQARISEQLASGAELWMVSVPGSAAKPVGLVGGLAKDFPHWDEFVQAVESFRRQEDALDP